MTSSDGYLAISAHRNIPVWAACLALLVGPLVGAGCDPFDGPLPERDALNYPVALELHPDGSTLYVLNGNFESEFRTDLGGTLVAIDLDEQRFDPERTRCLPSFGGDLMFSGTTWDNGFPRYLFAATRANSGLVAFEIDPEDPGMLRCLAEAVTVENTCVDDIASLPDVDPRRRQLPCEVTNAAADAFAMTLVPPLKNDPEGIDRVAVAGITSGEIRVVNFVDGEIRGFDPSTGDKDKENHLNEERFFVGVGTNTFATHPITGATYVGTRFTSSIPRLTWFFDPAESPQDSPRAGFVVGVGRDGSVRIESATGSSEVRDLVINDDASRLYAISQNPDAILIFNIEIDEEGDAYDDFIRRIPLDGEPSQILLGNIAGRAVAYVTLFDEKEIALVDLETERIVRRVQVGDEPYSMVYDAERKLIYVALFTQNAVGIVDADPASPSYFTLTGTIR